MADPSSYDDDLLRRLNRLKATPVILNPNTSILPTNVSPEEPADALSSRFRALKGSTAAKSPGFSEEQPVLYSEDDQSLDDLLKQLGPEEQWSLGVEDAGDVQDLLNEARKTISANALEQQAERPAQASEKASAAVEPSREGESQEFDVSAFSLKDADKASLNDEEEAQEYMSRVLAEVDIEDKYDSASDSAKELDRLDDIDDKQSDSSPSKTRVLGQDHPHDESSLDVHDLGLPSIPSAPLQPVSASSKSLDGNAQYEKSTNDLQARFASLSLPSVPKTAPKGKSSNLPKHTDEEIDSWCIICLDDATLKCLGCDGDLYCVKCWKEGHRGEGSGLEERRHRASAFTKKKRMAAA